MPFIRLQFRRGTASEWTTVNPVLASGELGLETDTKNIKMGDGATDWNHLPYGFSSLSLQSVTDNGNTTDNNIQISNTDPSTSSTTGALTVSGGVGIAGNLYVGGSISSANINPIPSTYTVGTSASVIGSFDTGTYRLAKYLISATYNTSYHGMEALLLSDGTAAYLTTYGVLATGAKLITLSATMSGTTAQLQATGAVAGVSVKVTTTKI